MPLKTKSPEHDHPAYRTTPYPHSWRQLQFTGTMSTSRTKLKDGKDHSLSVGRPRETRNRPHRCDRQDPSRRERPIPSSQRRLAGTMATSVNPQTVGVDATGTVGADQKSRSCLYTVSTEGYLSIWGWSRVPSKRGPNLVRPIGPVPS